MPEPKFVVAIGACACSGGVFAGCYNVVGGVDKVIPVNAYIPGCPPRPEALLDGVVKLLNALDPPKPKRKAKQAELSKEEAKPEAKRQEVVVPQEVKPIAMESKTNVKQ
jgi:NADH:ubiquinone oxidoreductase subunit B-like Fe-S oxidoreductase